MIHPAWGASLGNPTGTCKLCGQTAELQDSHIFSKHLYKPIYGEYPQYLEYDFDTRKRKKGQGGLREYLLCSACEVKRSKWERYADSFLNGRESLTWKKIPGADIYEMGGINYKQLKLFILSTLWLMSVSSSSSQFSDIDLGPHEENIRLMLLNEDPGPYEQYGVGLNQLKEDEAGKIMLSIGMKLRFDSHVYYRMVFGGYAWFVLVSSHKLPPDMNLLLINEKGSVLTKPVSVRQVGFLLDVADSLPRKWR